MTGHTLVCPPLPDLVDELRGHCIVLKSTRHEDMGTMVELGRRPDVSLHCIILDTHLPFTFIPLQHDWHDAPLAIFTPKIGSLHEALDQVPFLRDFNLRLYLDSCRPENLTAARVLTSCHLSCGVKLDPDVDPDWEALSDLMTYGLLTLNPHPHIEPFSYVATRFRSTNSVDFDGAYCDDPRQYLHVGRDGQVALSSKECKALDWIGHIDRLEDIPRSRPYLDRISEVDRFHRAPKQCSSCEAWRVCLGKFPGSASNGMGCKAFFVELMDVAERHQRLHAPRQERWRP